MKRYSFPYIAAVIVSLGISHSVQCQELVQNGDFSNNSAGATTYNMTNLVFTSTVAFCRGFGGANEIDLIYDSDNGPPPLVGNTKLRLHRQANGTYDAFSTTLLSPVVASGSYRLQMDVVSRYAYTETNLQVGISSSASSFGTLLQSVPVVAGSWTSIDVVLSAPVGGGYLTFRPDPDVVDGLVSVTNVSLAPAVDTYSVGGTVSGLTGSGLVLQNNAADDLPVAADGPFTFVTELADAATYAVTVSTQPSGQTCSVSNGNGTITAANVTDVAVTCVDDVVPTYTVGGTVSGLTGTGLVLQNNAADDLPVAADGPFTFVTELADAASYAVTVSSQPTGQTCGVTNGSGQIAAANVTNVAVTCVNDVVPTYSVGGTVSGLTGTGLVLQNNGIDDLLVAVDGSFGFATELTDGATYAVTVLTQPTGQTCSVSNGSGTITQSDVIGIVVTCVDDVIPPAPPAPAPLVPVPVMPPWALITLALLLGLMVYSNRKRLFR